MDMFVSRLQKLIILIFKYMGGVGNNERIRLFDRILLLNVFLNLINLMKP